MRISQLEKPQRENAIDGFDFAGQTFAIHEYLYGCMQEMKLTWKDRWDAALADQRWDDIKKLMSAMILLLPLSEQDLLIPAMHDFAPWEDEMKLYWPTVWIVDRWGDRHGHIAMQIYARSKNEALKKIPKGFELRSW